MTFEPVTGPRNTWFCPCPAHKQLGLIRPPPEDRRLYRLPDRLIETYYCPAGCRWQRIIRADSRTWHYIGQTPEPLSEPGDPA